jgi:protein tyrosine/serine phosphatase
VAVNVSTHPSNFREIHTGKISPKVLYRSNHPIFNGEPVKEIILAAKDAKIQTIINLSDTIRFLTQKVMQCPWYKKILEQNNVIALNLSMNFDILDTKFHEKIHDGLRFMIEHGPPYLIHCEAGIDRTGFLAALLESFMGAKIDDIVKDYMLSFGDIREYSLSNYREGLNFMMNMLGKIKGGIPDIDEDLQPFSETYLREKIKLSTTELQMLANRLMNQGSPAA